MQINRDLQTGFQYPLYSVSYPKDCGASSHTWKIFIIQPRSEEKW